MGSVLGEGTMTVLMSCGTCKALTICPAIHLDKAVIGDATTEFCISAQQDVAEREKIKWSVERSGSLVS